VSSIYDLASIGNILIGLMILAGGYIAMRSGRQQQAGAIQSQVIDALKAELETLQRRLEALEKENTRLEQTMGLIKHALRKRGLAISIDGDLVTIRDEHGGSQTGRIREER